MEEKLNKLNLQTEKTEPDAEQKSQDWIENRERLVNKALAILAEVDPLSNWKEAITSKCDLADEMAISRIHLYRCGVLTDHRVEEALEKIKRIVKRKMRRNWRGSDNPTLQIAEFRLLASEEERDAISHQYQKHSGKVEQTHEVGDNSKVHFSDLMQAIKEMKNGIKPKA